MEFTNKKDKFNFIDFGFMPNFEYRIEEYFSNNSQFYGIDASDETKYLKTNEIILNKLVTSKEIFPIRNIYSAVKVVKLLVILRSI